MDFIETIKERARSNIKKIVLPETSDLRTIKAASIALKEHYADIVLVGNKDNILKLAKENDLDISNATIVESLKVLK